MIINNPKNSEDVDGIIRHYFKCLDSNRWEGFDFQDACAILLPDIIDVLIEYGNCNEEQFILNNLKSKFVCLSSQEIDMKQEVHQEFKNGDIYYSFDCPYLCAYKKVEAKRFSEMQNKYKDNLDLKYLDNLYYMLKATMNHGVDSQEEAIELIRAVLYARHPRGAIFNLDVE